MRKEIILTVGVLVIGAAIVVNMLRDGLRVPDSMVVAGLILALFMVCTLAHGRRTSR